MDQLTLFAADSHVKILAQPERGKGLEARKAASGTRCSASSEKSDPLGCSLRTSLLSALEGMTMLPLVWKKQGTPCGRSWWVLGRSARPTSETGCGLWPTPRASDDDKAGANPSTETTIGRARLAAACKWPTPRAEDSEQTGAHSGTPDTLTSAARIWPTPNARDWKDTGTQGNRKSPNLGTVAHAGPLVQEPSSTDGSSPGLWPTPRVGSLDGGSNSRKAAAARGCGGIETTRSLNARWVLQLMGFPSDWCDLPTSVLSALRAMPSSPKSRK